MATRITTSSVNLGPNKPKSNVTKMAPSFIAKDGFVTLNRCGMVSMLDDARLMPHLTREVRDEADSVLKNIYGSCKPRKLTNSAFINRSIANVSLIGQYSNMPVLSPFEWVLWAADLITQTINCVIPSSKRSLGSVLLNSTSGFTVSVLRKEADKSSISNVNLVLSNNLIKLITATENIVDLARNTKKFELGPCFGGTQFSSSTGEKTEFGKASGRDYLEAKEQASIDNFSKYVLTFLGEINRLGDAAQGLSQLQLVDLGFYQGQIPADVAVAYSILQKLDVLIKLYSALSYVNASSPQFWQDMGTDLGKDIDASKVRKYCTATINYSFESFWLAPEYKESEKLEVPVLLASYLPNDIKSSLAVSSVEDYLSFARSIRSYVLEQTQLNDIRDRLAGQDDIVKHTAEGPVFTDKLLTLVADSIFGRSEKSKLLFEEQALFDYKEGKLAEAFAHFIMADCAGLSIKGVDYHKYMPLMACFMQIDDNVTIYGPAKGDRFVRSVIDAYLTSDSKEDAKKSVQNILQSVSVSPSTAQVDLVESFADPAYLSAVVEKDCEKYGRYFDFHIDILKTFYEPTSNKVLPTFTPKFVSHEGRVYCERMEARILSSISHGASKFHKYKIGDTEIQVLCTRSGDGSIYSDSISDDFDVVQESGVLLPPAEPLESRASSEDNPVERSIPGFFSDCASAKGVFVDDYKVIYHFGPRPVLQQWPFKLTKKDNYTEDDALYDLIKLYKFKALMSCAKFDYVVTEDFTGETVLRKANLSLKLEPVSIKPPAASNSALKYKLMGMHDHKDAGYRASTYLTEDTALQPSEVKNWTLTDTLFVYDKTDIEKARSGVSIANPKDSLFDLYLNRFAELTTGSPMMVRITPALVTASVEPMAIKTQFAVNGLARGKYLALDGAESSLKPRPVISLAYGLHPDQITSDNSKNGIKSALRWETITEDRYFKQRWLQPVQDLPESISDVIRDGETYQLRMPGKNPAVDVLLKFSPFEASPIYAEAYLCVDLKVHGFKAAREGKPSSTERLAQLLNAEQGSGKKPVIGLYSNEKFQVDVLPLPGLYGKAKSTWFTLFNPLNAPEVNGSVHIASFIKPRMYLHDAAESGLVNSLYLLRNLVRELDFFVCGLPSYTGEKCSFPLTAVLTQMADFVEADFGGVSKDSIYANDFGFSSGCTLRQIKKAIANLVKCFVKYTETNSVIKFSRVTQNKPLFVQEDPVELNDSNCLTLLKSIRSEKLSDSDTKLMNAYTAAMDTAYSVVTGTTHEKTLYFTHVPGEFVCTNLLFDSMNSLIGEQWNYWDLPDFGARLDSCAPSELGLNLSAITQERVQKNFWSHGVIEVVDWLLSDCLPVSARDGDTILSLPEEIRSYLEEQEKKIGIDSSSYVGLSMPAPTSSTDETEEASLSCKLQLLAPKDMVDDLLKSYGVAGKYGSGTLTISGKYSVVKLQRIVEQLCEDGIFSVIEDVKVKLSVNGPKYMIRVLKDELSKSYNLEEANKTKDEIMKKYSGINGFSVDLVNAVTGKPIETKGDNVKLIILPVDSDPEFVKDVLKKYNATEIKTKDIGKWKKDKSVLTLADLSKLNIDDSIKPLVLTDVNLAENKLDEDPKSDDKGAVKSDTK